MAKLTTKQKLLEIIKPEIVTNLDYFNTDKILCEKIYKKIIKPLENKIKKLTNKNND